MLQLLAARIQQHDGKHLEVDQLCHTVGDVVEQFVKVEDRRQLSTDLVQQRQALGLPRHSSVELRVLNTYRQPRSNQHQQAFVCFSECFRLVGLKVHYADHAVLDNQRDRQLRADFGQ